MPEIRVQTGVLLDEDGWWVIQDRTMDGSTVRNYIGQGSDAQPFLTEQDATAAADQVIKATRQFMDTLPTSTRTVAPTKRTNKKG